MLVWLEKELVLAIHDHQLAEHGGSSGVRDVSLLESALARPQLHAYSEPPPDLAALAASLAFGLARNHPFADGNKRSAYVVYRTFLLLNGAELRSTPEDKFITILALAEGRLKESEFAEWLRRHIELQRDRNEIHEDPPVYGSK